MRHALIVGEVAFALVLLTGEFRSYTGVIAPRVQTSMDAAIAQAAGETLAALFPSQAARFNDALAADLNELPNGSAKDNAYAPLRRER